MNTKKIIKNTFLTINQTKKIDEIKVSEVSRKAGISRTTFYSYYDDVYNIVEEIEDELLNQLAEKSKIRKTYKLQKHNVDNPLFLDMMIYEYMEEHKDEFRLLFGENGDPLFRYKYSKFLQEVVISKIMEDFQITEYKDFISAFIMSGITNMIEEWLIHHPEVDAKEMERISTKLMYGSFFNSKL